MMAMLAFTNSPMWPVLILSPPTLGLLVYLLYVRRHSRSGEAARIAKDGGSAFLSRDLMAYGYAMLEVPKRLCLAWHISPNGVTVMGSIVVTLSAFLIAAGYFGLGGMLMLAGSTADMLDGMLARALSATSDFGEYLDAVTDRWADIVVYGGLCAYYRSTPYAMMLMFTALTATVMVSYARAKAESLGVWDTPRGSMRRGERSVYLGFSIMLAPTLATLLEPGVPTPRYHLVLGIAGVIAVLSAHTCWLISRATAYALGQRPRITA